MTEPDDIVRHTMQAERDRAEAVNSVDGAEQSPPIVTRARRAHAR